MAVVITGASSGIGAACALHLAQAGFRVFAGVRREADGVSLKARASDRVDYFKLDVTNYDSIAAAVEQLTTEVGDRGIGGLVNNAGVVGIGPLEVLPLDELRKVLEVNVVGQVAVTQALLPLIRKGRGRLVFMSSLSGRVAAPLTGSYCASKFALEALSDVWRMELRAGGTPVSVIESGIVPTPIWNKTLESFRDILDTMPQDARARYAPLTSGVMAWAERGSRGGIRIEKVTDAVMHALVADTPKSRYVVGRGSRLFLLLRFMPDRLRDKLLLRALGSLP